MDFIEEKGGINMYTTRKLFIMLIVTSVSFTGCGGNIFEGMVDNDSSAAKTEEAKIALDKGNYDEAVNLLEDLCGTDTSNMTCDEETQTDLASAYIASATDLDVLQLINAADTAATTESFTTLSTLLPIADINACAASPSSCAIQSDMDKAIAILDNLLPDTVPAEPTSEQKNQYLQLATAAAVDIVVTVGLVSDGFNTDTGLPNTTPTSVSSEDLTDVSDNIGNIVLGLEGAGILDTGISQDIETIQSEISTDNTVTETELINYIDGL